MLHYCAGGTSPYDFGFNHEGFVTGGLAYLEAALAKLKARGIHVLVDMHALPGGSSSCQESEAQEGRSCPSSPFQHRITCFSTPHYLQSYSGWQVNQPLFWTGTPPPSNATAINAACGGAGPYYSSRGASKTWLEVGRAVAWKDLLNNPSVRIMQVGEDMIAALGAWVVALQGNASLSDVVVGLEVRTQ